MTMLRGSHAELHELERESRLASLVIRYFLLLTTIVILAFLISGQAYPKDRAMRSQALQLERAIQGYYAEELDYPDSLMDVLPYIDSERGWPANPYNGKPISDTGSDMFSSPDSIGMVHYEKLETGDSSGYRLTVFGKRGVLDTRFGGQTRWH